MISDNYVTGDNIYLRELQNFFFEVLGMMSITHYGAIGDGRKDNYGALQVAIDDAKRRGLSFIYVPYGRFIYTGELQNIGGIIFMGNPHAHIVNIRTGEEIEIHQFGWFGHNKVATLNDTIVLQNGATPSLETGFYIVDAGSVYIGSQTQSNLIAGPLEMFYYDNETKILTTAFEHLAYESDNWSRYRDEHYVAKTGDTMTGSLAIGPTCEASGTYSFAQGLDNTASGNYSHVEGIHNTASGSHAHVEGSSNTASAQGAHAEGNLTEASAQDAHAEGHSCVASATYSHAEGDGSTASGSTSHAEGRGTASGNYSHAEGLGNTASGNFSHAEGSYTTASGNSSHAEGNHTTASESDSHAEGSYTTASEHFSHAEGYYTTASGYCSHAGGKNSVASGWGGFAHGLEVKATRHTQTAFGIGNIEETGSTDNRESTTGLLILGNGSIDDSGGAWVVDTPSNAFKCTYAGDVYIAGSLTPNGADYAESVEWLDGNPNEEDRVGKFVVLEGNKMRLANSQDKKELIGVVSAKPTVLGDAFDSYWHGKYVTDVYGRIQYETRTLQEEIDEEGNVVHPASTQEVPIVSPDYDPTLEYVSRVQRKEYGSFAMLGKLIVEDDGTCEVGGYSFPNDNGIATANTNGYYVMERIDKNHIRIFVR